MQVNDVTGDTLCSRQGTKSEREAYESGWGNIDWSKKLTTEQIILTPVDDVTFGKEAPSEP